VVKAVRDGVVLAESDQTIIVEGNHYFPPGSVNWEHFRNNEHVSVCPWKGRATYFDVVVGDKVIGNAGWTYPKPSTAAMPLKDYVAFYRRFAFLGKVKIEG
jgi:uncharacterized protein (DUF427 family)